MKTIKFLLPALCALLLSANAQAYLIITLGKGIDQGSYNRKVTTSACIDIGGGEKSISTSCAEAGTAQCPTNQQLRTLCPGALIVTWITNDWIDEGVSDVLAAWDQGEGETSGLINMNVTNISTGATAVLSFAWSTTPNGDIKIIVDVVPNP